MEEDHLQTRAQTFEQLHKGQEEETEKLTDAQQAREQQECSLTAPVAEASLAGPLAVSGPLAVPSSSLPVPSSLSTCLSFSLPPPLLSSTPYSLVARDSWRRMSLASKNMSGRARGHSQRAEGATASKGVTMGAGRLVSGSASQRLERHKAFKDLGVSVLRRSGATDGRKTPPASFSSSSVKAGSSGLDASGEYVIMPRASYLLSYNPEERSAVAKRALDASTFGGAVPRGYGLCSSPSLGGCSGSLMGGVTGGGAVSRSEAAMLKRAGREKSLVRLGVCDPRPLQPHSTKEKVGGGKVLPGLFAPKVVVRIPHLRHLAVGETRAMRTIEEESDGRDVTCGAGKGISSEAQADIMHPVRKEAAREEEVGNVHGIGVALSLRTAEEQRQGKGEEDEIFVSALVPGGGLSRSKRVREGDVLLAVDGHTVTASDFKTCDLVSYLGGPAGSVVTLKFRRRTQQATSPATSSRSCNASVAACLADAVFTEVVVRGCPQVCPSLGSVAFRLVYHPHTCTLTSYTTTHLDHSPTRPPTHPQTHTHTVAGRMGVKSIRRNVSAGTSHVLAPSVPTSE